MGQTDRILWPCWDLSVLQLRICNWCSLEVQ